jgi:hypothetical protein
MISVLADITWRPGIGDPNPLAWSITLIHLLASWLCFSAGRSRCAESDARANCVTTRFWLVLAALMFAIGLNKQLDLQTLLTMWLREVAHRDGWYARRRVYQAVFVSGCAVAGMACAAASFYALRGHWRQCGLACSGVVFLLTFVVIRAASFHHVDQLICGLPWIGNGVNAGLELGGALLVSLGAFQAARRSMPNHKI